MYRTLAAITLMLGASTGAKAQEIELLTVGAGDVTGGYYASAAAICDIINRSNQGLVRCSPDPTTGSTYNLDALRNGELDFALVQSDWHRQAYLGTGPYAADGPMDNLRSVMGLYGETLTILARADSGIGGWADILGKRIDIGHPASGRRGTVDQVLAILGMDYADFAQVAEFPVGTALDSLCQGKIDVTILVVGHPNPGLARVMEECDAVLVPLGPDETEAILAGLPDLKRSIIAQDSYVGMATGVASVAVTATVVTLAETAPEIVANLVETTLTNLPLLARMAPVLEDLDPARMRTIGLTAPLHDGAESAFAGAGYP